jgi:XTP/dITP diphosphohydrolase
MKSLVFATNNRHKLIEIKEILKGLAIVSGLEETGFSGEIPEEHDTLEGNAAQKAFFIYDRFGLECFADDTGLEIDALNGDPGVYSARYAGPGCTFDDNMNLVLTRMKDNPNRNARFRTVIALVEKGSVMFFEGLIPGKITIKKLGAHGFGYDPIFQPEGYTKTFAEMHLDEKNMISHRAIAVGKLLNYLKLSQNV